MQGDQHATRAEINTMKQHSVNSKRRTNQKHQNLIFYAAKIEYTQYMAAKII